ncbi:hypothetical protein BCR33DRAFT_721621 [Rhizoclosmatium globosum]|uniref:Uncharacterized protein n=1 Tax=Rhizoclosmatium globosum TaxID=329046 RepID=A0A1Y2BRA3_9FUNG|nr:hypothetical protein BCR33DRAFT_727401 [Rhizoclosmatium globosum]ORY37271.1 hypothetical protein BCR33DRAFT_721621 [Rhizoclosmatium globosum]|eukprot:ORY24541.1 hypothetical protein BCR33DRAFT_727401 [Rhizoclosmatium globosum]
MSYSPLFQASESAPSLALFAYPADHFDDGENIPSFKKSFSVVEVHSFEPFDVVYESVKTRVEAEGMVKNGRTVIFAIVNGESGDAAVICEKLVGEYGLKSVKFGGEEEGDAGIVVESDVAIEDVDEEISAQIAEHLLESVRVEVGKAKENKAAGLIVEASLGFSPLFDSSSDSEEKPALALFAYPAEHFDDSELVDLSNALNVIEVHSYEPFESVVESVKKSLEGEGLVDGFNVIFAIGSGASNEQSHLLCVKLAEEFGLRLFQFGTQ